MGLTALTDKGIAIVYGDSPNFVQLQHPEYGKEYNNFVFFAIHGGRIETDDTDLELPARGGMEWFWDCVERVFEAYGISYDILERIKEDLG